MKNPLDIAELMGDGFSWSESVTAARPLGHVFWRRVRIALALAGIAFWAGAGWFSVAHAEDQIEAEQARAARIARKLAEREG